MKNKSLLPILGIIIYIILSIIDKFVLKVSDYVYISLSIIAMILIIIGLIKDRRKK